MSLEIKIPKEITQYEAKLIGPLTTRQTIWTVLGGIAAIGTHALTKAIIPDYALYITLFACVPFALVGFVKVYEMPFEQFAIGYIKTNLITSTKRKSIVKNQFALIAAEIDSIETKKPKYKKSKQAFK